MITWARMSFKTAKFRSLVLKKGKTSDKFCFTLGSTQTPSITEKPMKSLGKVFDCSLRDTASIRATNEELEAWLGAVDTSGLPGKFKAWIYQQGIFPRIPWPLLVYEVPTVEGFERRVSKFLRKWLGLLRSLSSITLYGQNNKLRLLINSLNEDFMVSRTRKVLQYRESSDPIDFQAGIKVKTGRKWRAAEGVDAAESWLRHRALAAALTCGRASLGSSTIPHYDKAKRKYRRVLVQDEVWASLEDASVYSLSSFRYLGVHIAEDLTWTTHIDTLVRKAKQYLYHLRQLRKF